MELSINRFEKFMREQGKELEKLQTENAAWKEEFDSLIKFRNTASAFEKDGKLNEAIEEYKKSISLGLNSNRLNFSNYSHDIERVVILYNKTKQKETLKLFLEQLIAKYPEYKDAQKWAVRLSALTKEKVVNPSILPNDIEKQFQSNPSLGARFKMFIGTFPKFNFYYDLPEGMTTMQYLFVRKPVPIEKTRELGELKNAFQKILNRAKIAENENNIKTAIEAYQKLVLEQYEDNEPYDRLMIIYRHLGWINEEKKIIELSIEFFSNLKEEQKNNVLSIAREYNMESKALEYINNGKKIFYYGGAFELYNPFPIIEKWKKRLLKIEHNKSKKRLTE